MFQEVTEACFRQKRFKLFWQELDIFLYVNIDRKYLESSLDLFEVVAE